MALLSTIRDLHRRKARERRGLALAEGIRLVEEMLAAGVACRGVAVGPALRETPRGVSLLRQLTARGIPVEEITDAEFSEVAATEHPQGVVAVYQPREWALDDLLPIPRRPLLILDGVQDPGNVGTIARAAVAFGASGLIALPGTADLENPKTVRGAMGALFRLPHLHAEDATVLSWLSSNHVALWATAMTGEPIGSGAPAFPIALVLGNEGTGVRDELLARADQRVSIPIQPVAESLNVAVAAGIILHQVTR